MEAKVIENIYENGKRISTQRITYEKSDDLFTLANLHRQYESVCKRLSENSSTSDSTYLISEKERLEHEIEAQEAIVRLYE